MNRVDLYLNVPDIAGNVAKYRVGERIEVEGGGDYYFCVLESVVADWPTVSLPVANEGHFPERILHPASELEW